MENNELTKVRIKNPTSYYFDDIIKLEDFDIVNILIDEKSHENILIYSILYKTLIGSKLFCMDLIKQMDLLELVMELDI